VSRAAGVEVQQVGVNGSARAEYRADQNVREIFLVTYLGKILVTYLGKIVGVAECDLLATIAPTDGNNAAGRKLCTPVVTNRRTMDP
jgi:hypothetical protein